MRVFSSKALFYKKLKLSDMYINGFFKKYIYIYNYTYGMNFHGLDLSVIS